MESWFREIHRPAQDTDALDESDFVDPHHVLKDFFDDTPQGDVVLVAAQLEREGNWLPKGYPRERTSGPNGPGVGAADGVLLLRAQDIVRRASFEDLLFGTSEELACRQHIRDAVQGVRSLLETADETARVIGHNRPPQASTLRSELGQFRLAINSLASQIQRQEADLGLVISNALELQRLAQQAKLPSDLEQIASEKFVGSYASTLGRGLAIGTLALGGSLVLAIHHLVHLVTLWLVEIIPGLGSGAVAP
ncbi:MAG TPA: hypothetical protein DHW63_00975 [Hyphomonadaceae bacterium]|nr:hypothetical protein [Hyphomonadaceae bacterium]